MQAAKYVLRRGEEPAEMMARCLFPSPSFCLPATEVPEENRVRFVGVFPGWRFSGRVFVDGSAFHNHLQGLSRAGWAVIQVNRAGELVGAMYGAAPLHQAPAQSARDGEDWAFHMLSQFSEWSSEDPLVVHTDCAGSF
eukprot:5006926-Pyramimonas_sp.AAC.1